jgi:hypothetical protein
MGVGGAYKLQPPPPHPILKFKKNTVFVDLMVSNALRDLPFSHTQPLKLADKYISILKN